MTEIINTNDQLICRTLKDDEVPVPITVGQLEQLKRDVARRCAEIAEEHVPFLHGRFDGKLIGAGIRREFGLPTPEPDAGTGRDAEAEMSEPMTTAQTPFFVVNGIEVFDNGDLRIWRCPRCAWWRDWSDTRCPVCCTERDGDRMI